MKRSIHLKFLLYGLLCGQVMAQNEVVSLTLIDASKNDPDPAAEIQTLVDGDTLNLAALPPQLNIRANVTSEEAGTQSVEFVLTGATSTTKTESAAPYALGGDTSGDYANFSFNTGQHTLTATPYSGDGKGGSAGTALAIGFTVVNQISGDPVVMITSPTNGSSATAPADFTLTAEASDPDGSVASVEFFRNGTTSLGMDTTAPFSVNWNNVPEGNYSLTAVATDNDSNTTSSTPVSVNVVTAGTGGSVAGELKKWHKVTIDFDGPATSETATPNPFLDYRLDVTFTGPEGQEYVVPGYYAADGDPANTGATSGNKWRAHFAPDAVGTWTYVASFVTAANVATDETVTGTATGFHGASGTFTIAASDKSGRDFRGKGRLQYVNKHHLRFADSGEYFLKQGPDAPENFLAYADFDGPFKTDGNKDDLVKTWAAHAGDWTAGDPVWNQRDGTAGTYGKAMIGALNYLASEGLNVFSFLTMNIQGDDRNVFPYLNYNERSRLDVSRLAQWEIIFEHADELGLFLHFKTQETENDLLLDGGELGNQRKLYYRELIARFGHHLALNWNLGEENDIWRTDELNDPTQTRVKSYAQYFYDHDPYRHPVVIHTYPGEKDEVYGPLLGNVSKMSGASLQTSNSSFSNVHGDVKTWVANSAAAGKPWIIACDEPGDAQHALRPDNDAGNSHEDGRKNALWGTFLAGGWGNEWYFGYGHAHSDLTCEDFRSRDLWWDYCRYALEFFDQASVPFWDMVNDNGLTNADYCYYKDDEAYIIYDKIGGAADIDLPGQTGPFSVRWYDPRNGGALQTGSVSTIMGGTENISLGTAPGGNTEDWVVLVRRAKGIAYIYGDIAADGTLPSGAAPPYDQMLLTDSGNTGLSEFKTLVENEGYSIEQSYDQDTTLDAAYLDQFSVIIFGLHQKIWSAAEKAALDTWLRAGGGMLIYSDSAAGGRFNLVGAQNTTGQTVVNNLISQYGMEVTVDQANGIKTATAGPSATHPIVLGNVVLEGEGVSPVAVSPGGTAVRLIPYEGEPIPHQQNLTIQNPQFAALALQRVGSGNVIAMFDRQPMWNNGPGSDIDEEDNREILRRIVNFLATPSQPDTQSFAEFIAGYPSLAGNDALALADPDDDGLANVMEQWLMRDPTKPDTAGAFILSTESTPPTVAFSFNSTVTGSELIYEISPDLKIWTPTDIDSQHITEEGDIRHVAIPVDLGDAPMFHRLRVDLE